MNEFESIDPTALSPKELNHRLDNAISIAREAGRMAMGYFNQNADLSIQAKGSQDWVTQADLSVEQFIRDRIQSLYPTESILGEEYGHSNWEDNGLMWLIDPIDGTTFFLKGIPQWTVVIGLAIGGETMLSVVYEPVSGELFTALKGQGSTLNERPLSVDPTDDLNSGLVAVSASAKLKGNTSARIIDQLVNQGSMYCRLGSCALCLAYVASGRLLAMYEPYIHPWDSWAGELIVTEAGGRILPREYAAGIGKPGPTIAATPRVWDAFTELIRS